MNGRWSQKAGAGVAISESKACKVTTMPDTCLTADCRCPSVRSSALKTIFGLLVSLSLSACAHQHNNVQAPDNGHLANVVNDPDSVLVLAVNGEQRETKSMVEFVSGSGVFNSYLSPGLTRFTIQYSYKGFVATTEDKSAKKDFETPVIEDICFTLSAGEIYRISSDIFSGVPAVGRKETNGEFLPVSLSGCDAPVS